MAPKSIRTRLSLWSGCAVLVILLIYATGTYVFVRESSYRTLVERLMEDFERAESHLESAGNSGIQWRLDSQHERIASAGDHYRWYVVWGRHGKLLLDHWPAAARPEYKLITTSSLRSFESMELPGWGVMGLLSGQYQVGALPVTICVARSEAGLRRELRELLFILLIGLPFAVGLAFLFGMFLAKRALAPVGRMAEQAKTITAARLQERLPVDNPMDELGSLALVFNETLARLDDSFQEMRRFTADASHELRTPLSALRSVGEVGLAGNRSEAGYREVIGSMPEEVERLSRLIESLLTLARADSQTVQARNVSVSLTELVSEVRAFLQALAEEKKQSILLDADGDFLVIADRAVLRQAIVNLLHNAIKYSPAGSTIRMRLLQDEQETILELADEGPGIRQEHIERIFDRFYRVDPARSCADGGTGLGLAITRWAVEFNGGRVEVESPAGKDIGSDVGRGSLFRIRFPRKDQSS